MYREEVREIRHSDERTFAVLSSSRDGAHQLSEIYPAEGRIDQEQRQIKYRIHGRPGNKVGRLPESAVLRQGGFHGTDYRNGETIMFFVKRIYVID